MLNGEVEIKLKTQKRFGFKNENRKDYYKTAILNSEYGIQILFWLYKEMGFNPPFLLNYFD